MGLVAYFTRKLPEPKCVTEIPALRELWRLIAASLPLAAFKPTVLDCRKSLDINARPPTR